MATIAETAPDGGRRPDILSGTPRAHPIDRWVYVFTAASFIAIVLAGFVPSSIEKAGAVRAGLRPPFPLIMHVHAVLMGAFLLLLLRIGILFPILLWIGLRARRGEPGLHKRMMILATAVAIPAGIDRIPWLPTTMPASPLGADLWTLVAISPMLVWDLVRNRTLHRAWWIWLGLFLPFAVAVNLLWDTAWWHGTAKVIMGV
jgi:hypothetical protein